MSPLTTYALEGFGLAALIILLMLTLRRLLAVGPARTVADRKKGSWS